MEDLYPKYRVSSRPVVPSKKFDFEGISKLLQELKLKDVTRSTTPSIRPKTSQQKASTRDNYKLFELNNMSFNFSFSSSDSENSTDSTDNYYEPSKPQTHSR